MLKIQNSADLAKIEIIGDIGEGWFSEGVTVKDIRNKINNINAPEIEVTISSLGGDFFEGLSIRDSLKQHPAKVTAKMIGANASAATICAMGADSIEISKAGIFLIHNVSTGVWGNQHDLKELIGELESLDNVLADIYVDKTGKTRDDILDLMKQDRWLNSTEALELGLVDAVTEGSPMSNKVIEMINESNLPNIEDMDFNKFKTEVQEKFDSILNAIKGKKTEEEVQQFEDFKTEIDNQIEAFKTELTEANEAENVIKDEKITELENSISEKDTKIQDLEAKVEELTATSKQNHPEGDPDLDKSKPDGWQKEVKNLLK